MNLIEVPAVKTNEVPNFLTYLNDRVQGVVQVRPLSVDEGILPFLRGDFRISEIVLEGCSGRNFVIEQRYPNGGIDLEYQGIIPGYYNSSTGNERVILRLTTRINMGTYRADHHSMVPFP